MNYAILCGIYEITRFYAVNSKLRDSAHTALNHCLWSCYTVTSNTIFLYRAPSLYRNLLYHAPVYRTLLYHPRYTVPMHTVERTVNDARKRGMKIFLFPILRVEDKSDGGWRGTLAPNDKDAFYKNYTAY
ncbi:MAG: hypothetical protein GY820_47100, partial [Gammaproteobacteria bacterium]|nr:hypothetical protein [Gammaproteobacteria bacterium]